MRAGNHVAAGDFHRAAATGNVDHTLPLDEVGSTAWQNRNHAVTASHRVGEHLWQASLSHQSIP